jgi:hypothetical protein
VADHNLQHHGKPNAEASTQVKDRRQVQASPKPTSQKQRPALNGPYYPQFTSKKTLRMRQIRLIAHSARMIVSRSSQFKIFCIEVVWPGNLIAIAKNAFF